MLHVPDTQDPPVVFGRLVQFTRDEQTFPHDVSTQSAVSQPSSSLKLQSR